jgi:hypothetical protein
LVRIPRWSRRRLAPALPGEFRFFEVVHRATMNTYAQKVKP